MSFVFLALYDWLSASGAALKDKDKWFPQTLPES